MYNIGNNVVCEISISQHSRSLQTRKAKGVTMFSSKSVQHPTWDDFAQALQLVDVYVSIEKNECDANTLHRIRSLAKSHYAYDDPASYIRFVLYPQLMRDANWIDDKAHVGMGTFVHYYGRRGDIDEFFSQMIAMGSARSTYMEIAAIVRDDTDE